MPPCRRHCHQCLTSAGTTRLLTRITPCVSVYPARAFDSYTILWQTHLQSRSPWRTQRKYFRQAAAERHEPAEGLLHLKLKHSLLVITQRVLSRAGALQHRRAFLVERASSIEHSLTRLFKRGGPRPRCEEGPTFGGSIRRTECFCQSWSSATTPPPALPTGELTEPNRRHRYPWAR